MPESPAPMTMASNGSLGWAWVVDIKPLLFSVVSRS
jgi:hypothetical protein